MNGDLHETAADEGPPFCSGSRDHDWSDRPASNGRDRRPPGRHCAAGSSVLSTLARLGPIYMAFGLYMSSRIDLLQREDCLELGEIADERVPTCPGEVRKLVGRELGAPPEEIFSVFHEDPFQIRLLSQSHRAWFADGTPVSVTVAHPDVAEDFADKNSLNTLGETFAILGLPQACFDEAVLDFQRTLQRHSEHQLQLLEDLHKDAALWPLLCAPLVHRHLCSPKVTTTSLVHGFDMSRHARGNCEPAEMSRRLLLLWLRQALLGEAFPAEPRQRDITVTGDHRIAFGESFLDSLTPEAQANLWGYLTAASNEDVDKAFSALHAETNQQSTGCDAGEARRRFRQIAPLERGSRTDDGCGLAGQLFAQWRLLSACGHMPEPHLASFYRGLFSVVAITQRLAPGQDTLREALCELRVVAGFEELRGLTAPNAVGGLLVEIAAAIVTLPQRCNRAFSIRADEFGLTRGQGCQLLPLELDTTSPNLQVTGYKSSELDRASAAYERAEAENESAMMQY